MKKLFFNFNRLLLLGLAVMMAGSGVVAATVTQLYTTGFENKTASASYQGTVTLSSTEGDGASWTIFYGCVSTTNKITGNNSVQMRVYKNNSNWGYLRQTSNIANVDSVKFTFQVTHTGVKFDVLYSTDDGSNWTTLESSVSASQTKTAYTKAYKLPSRAAKFRLSVNINSSSAHTNNTARQLIVDDIYYYKIDAGSTPELTTSASSLAFGNVESGSNKSLNTLTVSGANLTNDITYAISGTNASFFSVTSPSSPISKGTGTVSATPITVKYAPTSTGSHSAKLTFSSTGATAKEVTLTGTGTAPACTTSPTVSAGAISNPGLNSLTFNCASGISSLGSAGCTITEYGYVYGTSANPTTSDTKHSMGTTYTTTGTSFGAYTPDNLSCGTTYYMRPYAINGNGTSYGTQASAKTSDCPVDVFIDNMHSTGDFASPGKSFSSAYTKAAITISDKTPTAPTGVCATDHYHFVGWITAATKSSKTPPYADGDLVSFNESSNAPTGTTYYAVWAKETE